MTKKAIRSTLKNLPKGSTALDEAYDEAIERIKGQLPEESELAKNVLSWITYAERQLTTTELCHALAVEAGESELDEDNIPDIEDIISVCAGLVAVDEESDVIRLVHYTTQEYFERVREVWNPKAQEEIASTCLTYLSFQTFNAGHCENDADFKTRLRQNPFLDYAARYWGNHALTVQETIKGLALSFLCNTNQLACSSQAMVVENYSYTNYSQNIPQSLTGIHVAVIFRMTYLLQELLHGDGNNNIKHIDARDSFGQTPLSWAAQRGHEAVARLLVEQDNVMADSKDNEGQTPLMWAAQEGHEAIVKLLVERDDVVADLKDNEGQTPLSWVACGGNEAIAKLLVERNDVVADSKDNQGRTPLWWAAWGGHEAIVRLLVEREDVIADSKNNKGQTPLSCAAGGWSYNDEGIAAVVKLLINRGDVVADSKDITGRTPLSWAAEEGNEAIVKLLVERDDVMADSKDKDGHTPLWYAEKHGREAIVKLLVERDDVIADSKDDDGHTPLWWAEKHEHEAVANLLNEWTPKNRAI